MPRVTAKSMAEMIALPAHVQMRILTNQKYPRQGPAIFRVPYYAPAVNTFRRTYDSGAPLTEIDAEIARSASFRNAARRENLERALNMFKETQDWGRGLHVTARKRVEVAIGTVDLRASADVDAIDDNGRPVVIYYNCKSVRFDPEATKRLLEIAHWLYEQHEIDVPLNRFEMLDLADGTIHRISRPRAATIHNMKQTARAIESLWDAI